MDLSRAIKNVSSLIKSENIAEVVPLLDSINYSKMDSVFYRITLINPNIFYKVKIVSLKKLKHYWGKYYKYFNSPTSSITSPSDSQTSGIKRPKNIPPAFLLIYTPLEDLNQSYELYPEFWGKDRTEVRFKLIIREVNGDLKLYISYTKGEANNTWVDYEVISKVVSGKKYWILDRKLVYYFDYKDITKLVYITLKAQQIDDHTIKVSNYIDTRRLSFMQYPALEFSYISEAKYP